MAQTDSRGGPMRPLFSALLFGTVAPLWLSAQASDSIHVTSNVERMVQRSPLQAFCVVNWRVRPRALEIVDVIPAPDSSAEMARCAGYPVMLVRPICMVTLPEGFHYAATAPAVVIRCAPHAQAIYNPRVPFPTKTLERVE